MPEPALMFLIICSDEGGERPATLGHLLKEKGTVYRVEGKDGAARYRRFGSTGWQNVAGKDVPVVFDALFFHTGDNDYLDIPSDRRHKVAFAFSGGGVTADWLVDHKIAAIPIERPFKTTSCPVKEHHIDELLKFLSGQRKQTPTFCRYGGEVPTLWSIVILCEAYVCAGIAARANTLDKDFYKAVYPEPVLRESILPKRHDLARLWSSMQSAAWSKSKLGIWDSENNRVDDRAYRELLQSLATELEIVDDICDHIHEQTGKATLAESLSIDQLENGIRKGGERFRTDPPQSIIAFLNSSEPWRNGEAAFRTAKKIIEE
ncbi:MAG TPA: hypothetical protein PKE26_12450 [Kiritimatiellia bacterium]|nr:hypothetical protein [Kiritimatiellia bacterium]HMO99911.1 hypothetical protein [Kiritimatiellia bacterium]HMP96052.1 hypothetical protein [Kiritimatiellia bacterium]